MSQKRRLEYPSTCTLTCTPADRQPCFQNVPCEVEQGLREYVLFYLGYRQFQFREIFDDVTRCDGDLIIFPICLYTAFLMDSLVCHVCMWDPMWSLNCQISCALLCTKCMHKIRHFSLVCDRLRNSENAVTCLMVTASKGLRWIFDVDDLGVC